MEHKPENGQAGAEVTITPAMVVAGVKRIRKSLGESSLGSGDAVVVLEVLETALLARKGGTGNSLTPSSRQQILVDSLRCL